MNYVHCSVCARAYDLARGPCPSCERQLSDPTEAIVAAAEHLRRALERASPDQIAVARERLGVVPVLDEPPAPRMLPPPAPRWRDTVARVYAKFLFAKSQFTSFQNSSMYFGRALRKSM